MNKVTTFYLISSVNERLDQPVHIILADNRQKSQSPKINSHNWNISLPHIAERFQECTISSHANHEFHIPFKICSVENTSELQTHGQHVSRDLLVKKNIKRK